MTWGTLTHRRPGAKVEWSDEETGMARHGEWTGAYRVRHVKGQGAVLTDELVIREVIGREGQLGVVSVPDEAVVFLAAAAS